uniref:RING-type domain-containing protein n=1 Tax=Globodera pallida TaxID=36090 RepID=A0A183CGG4_GLOPA
MRLVSLLLLLLSTKHWLAMLQSGHNTCPICRQSLPETSTAAQTLNDHLLLTRQRNIASSSASINSAALGDAANGGAVGAGPNAEAQPAESVDDRRGIETAQGTEEADQ